MKKNILAILLFLVFCQNSYTLSSTRQNSVNPHYQSYQQNWQHYLTINAIPLMINDYNSTIQKIDISDFNKYKVYLIGENHATQKNTDVELFWIKLLNNTQQVNYIFYEFGYADAQLVNLYLKSGNEIYINKIVENLASSFADSEDVLILFREVYKYNKTLTEEQQLKFVGIDIQHQYQTALYYLNILLPKDPPPKLIEKQIKRLKSYNQTPYSDQELQSLALSIKKHRTEYSQYLGQNMTNFEVTIANILQGLRYYQLYDNNKEYESARVREQYLIKNFITIYNTLSYAYKSIGIFGSYHTFLHNGNMASHLNQNYQPLRGKIATFTLVYYNSYYRDRNNITIRRIPDTKFSQMMNTTTNADITFYKLDKNDSIFVKDGSVKAQQYLILVKNSLAYRKHNKRK